jgi:hypothetical protein
MEDSKFVYRIFMLKLVLERAVGAFYRRSEANVQTFY